MRSTATTPGKASRTTKRAPPRSWRFWSKANVDVARMGDAVRDLPQGGRVGQHVRQYHTGYNAMIYERGRRAGDDALHKVKVDEVTFNAEPSSTSS